MRILRTAARAGDGKEEQASETKGGRGVSQQMQPQEVARGRCRSHATEAARGEVLCGIVCQGLLTNFQEDWQ